jgi:mannitol/fructose-specific phosphotransferase system IIA component (Ntr-type)
MKIRSENIICYPNYVQSGVSLYKISDFDNRAFITINMNALIRIIEDNSNDMDLVVMIAYNYGKFNDEQLEKVLSKLNYIFAHNEKYSAFRKAKSIEFV